jgi:pyruvate/2-oxoglutarate dehydrogenase complex dihydrolipoamide acyltransferase (E2) component
LLAKWAAFSTAGINGQHVPERGREQAEHAAREAAELEPAPAPAPTTAPAPASAAGSTTTAAAADGEKLVWQRSEGGIDGGGVGGGGRRQRRFEVEYPSSGDARRRIQELAAADVRDPYPRFRRDATYMTPSELHALYDNLSLGETVDRVVTVTGMYCTRPYSHFCVFLLFLHTILLYMDICYNVFVGPRVSIPLGVRRNE